LAAAAIANAAAAFPNPGGAPGSETGDAIAPFAGLAEPASAGNYRGTATVNIPIEVPPAKGNATPNLALHYNSATGSSAYGRGWSLPGASVRRSPKFGVPAYDDSDTFVLNLAAGAVELRAIPGTPRFEAVTEGAFLRIGFDRENNRWRVVDKSGTTFFFGEEPESRSGIDVDHAGGTAVWYIHATEDSFSNRVEYRYAPGEPGYGASGRLQSIRYGHNAWAGTQPPFEILFEWSTVAYPSVPVRFFRHGYAETEDAVLSAIETRAENVAVRRYTLSHEIDGVTGDVLLAGVSLDAFGDGPAFDVALPSTVFDYASPWQPHWPFGTTAERRSGALAFDSPGGFRDFGTDIDFDTFDLDGDSRADRVDARTNPPTIRRGTSTGFAAAAAWPWPATPRRVRKTNDGNDLVVQIFDLTGDGLPDLVDGRENACGSQTTWCVYENTGNGFSLSPTPWPAPHAEIRVADAVGERILKDVIDLDGDGRPDAVDATGYDERTPSWIVHWNTGDGFSAEPTRFPAPGPLISRSAVVDTRSHLLHGIHDMNGDGLPDFVKADVHDTGAPSYASVDGWQVFLNTGYGFLETPTLWEVEGPLEIRLPNYLSLVDSQPNSSVTTVDFVDMTGDGRPDWVRNYSGADYLEFGMAAPACESNACPSAGSQSSPECCFPLLVFVNTGASFSAPAGWGAWDEYRLRSISKNPQSDEREFDLFDFDGDGLIDLVEIEDGQWVVHGNPAVAEDPSTPGAARVRPGLLTSMMNGIGGETHLDYAPASNSDLNRLPFPYWMVVRREIRDGVAGVSAGRTTFAYRDALFDAEDREFRGFGAVAETDPVGRTTVSEFIQEEPLSGRVSAVRLLGDPGCDAPSPWTGQGGCDSWSRVLRSEDNVWRTSPYPALISRTSIPHAGGIAIPELARRIDYAYDAFGNVTREEVSSASATAVITDTTHEILVEDDVSGMPKRYFANRPRTVRTVEPSRSSSPLVEKTFAYDLSKTRFGALTQTRTCLVFAGTRCDRWESSRFRHDRFGNVVSSTTANGATTRSVFDDLGLYAVRTTTAAGIRTETRRDLRHGGATHTSTSDGRSYRTLFDGIGRPILTWQNGGSPSDPDVEAWYYDATPDASPGHIRVAERGAAPISVFFDGLGRRIATKTLVETESGIVTMVSGIRRYDEKGQLLGETVAFVAPDADLDSLSADWTDAPAATEYLYDRDGRLRTIVSPDGAVTEIRTSVPGIRITANPNLLDERYEGSANIEFSDGLGRVWKTMTCGAMPSDAGECPAPDVLDTVAWEHDGLDRPVEMLAGGDPANLSFKRWEYDGAGNRKHFSGSNLGTWTYEYEPGGLLAVAVDPRGSVVRNRYDKAGRLKKQKAGSFRAAYQYHRKGSGSGRLRRVKSRTENIGVRKDFEYDERSRVASESISIKEQAFRSEHTFSYGYDDADRRTTVSYVPQNGSETVLTTSFGAFGLPRALTLSEGGDVRTIVADARYDEYGRTTRLDYGNGLGDRFGYAPASELGRLRCMRTARTDYPGGGCDVYPLDDRAVEITERDAAGNVLSITDRIFAGHVLEASSAYRYDALGRLVENRLPARPDEHFAYDANGNLTQNRGALFAYEAGAPNRLLAAGTDAIAHDAAGNRVSKGGTFYDYDELGRLRETGDGGTVRTRYGYDEGRTRVSRYDEPTGRATHYVLGFLEIDETKTVRHFHFGGRLVGSETIRHDAATGPTNAVGIRRAGSLAALLALLACFALRSNRARIAMTTAIAVFVATTPAGFAVANPATGPERAYFHTDAVGSPVAISDETGRVVEYRNYGAFGALDDARTSDGVPIVPAATARAFGGHHRESTDGLVYMGSRFYDADLGLFLTPDPEAQYRSPYLYGGGNPTNGFDPDGESLFGFFLAVFVPILTSAAVSALVSGFAASFQGGKFADGLSAGFVSGLVGAGLGTLAGSVNVGYQMAAGGSQWIGTGEALGAITEVARRSAFTSALTNSAVSAGDAGGLGSDWNTALGVAAGLVGSYAYDSFVIQESGGAGASFASQREMARDGVTLANTTTGHTNVTAEAAMGTGWERHTADLVRANVAQDGDGTFFGNVRAVLTNEEHFGRLPATIKGIRASVARGVEAFTKPASGVSFVQARDEFVQAVGGATHFIQDHLTLGHMVPGTRAFGGPLTAPIRFVVHQVFGGEIAFRDAQVRATRDLLGATPMPL
jgi:RHS repeat-associated protein